MTVYCKIADGIVVNRAEFEDAMPEGWAGENDQWVENDEAQIGWAYDGGAFTAPLPEPVPSSAVNAERDRRIYLPKSVALSTGKNFTVDMTGDSRANVSDLGIAAIAKKAIGNNTTVSFRDADNIDHDLSNDEVIEMGLIIADQVQAIHLAARTLKALSPIPADFADDSNWPA